MCRPAGSGKTLLAMEFLVRGITTRRCGRSWRKLVASLIDTCLLLRVMDGNGEHNRVLTVLKSRGIPHSNQVRESRSLTGGSSSLDVYVGPQGVLIGSARSAQEARERIDAVER